MEVPQKTKGRITMWSRNFTSGYLSEENKNTNSENTPVFIVAVFIITKIWKQPKCPLIDKWIKKMSCMCVVCVCARARMHAHTYTMEYYSTIKKNEIFVDLEGIMLISEISQRKTNTV